jgi:hypothetical protein
MQGEFKGKKSYALYNARSPFIANMKARYPLPEVQQISGHDIGSDTTTSSHAGARAAHGRVKPAQAERDQRDLKRQQAAAANSFAA